MATGNHSKTIQGELEPNGFEQITSVAAAIGLTIPAETKLILIQPEVQNVRWRDDNTDPTSSVGMKLLANDILVYSGTKNQIKFIEEAAGAKLNITYYK